MMTRVAYGGAQPEVLVCADEECSAHCGSEERYAARRTGSRMKDETSRTNPRPMLWFLCALAFAVFLWPALLTFDAGDWPSPNQYPHHSPAHNACGIVGAWFGYQFHYYLGDGAYPLLLFVTLACVMHLVRGELGHLWERVFGLTLLVACTSASTHLISAQATTALPIGNGGLIGYGLGELLTGNLSRVGTVIVLTSTLIVGILFVTEGWVLTLPSVFARMGHASGKTLAYARAGAAAALNPASPPTDDTVTHDERQALVAAQRPELKINTNCPILAKGRDVAGQTKLFIDDEPPAEHSADAASKSPAAPSEADRTQRDAGHDAATGRAAGQEKKGQPPKPPKVNTPLAPRSAPSRAYPRQIENWRLPSLDLLKEPEYEFTAKQEVMVRKQARVLEQTLAEFRLDAHVVEIDTGPVITMFELKLGAGVKVSQIATLSNDIARALKSYAIRVVAPISGKNTVGIEVPNITKEMVRLRELMTLAGHKAHGMALPLFLGKDAGGAAIVGDLTKMPHLLIAGTTGSGKSICLNAITASLLMTKPPDQVKMILLDPKMVEMSQFREIPHLMCPIITDMVRAEKILEWAVTKMEERYELFAEAGVKNIAGYNALGKKEIYRRFNPTSDDERAQISTRLPYIVIIIDELADLMMTSAKEVEHHLSRLAQKSRAVGVHIIVATQRPEARVVTGLIKSNLPARICFRVASRMDSRIVLDQNGGEVLMGQGDMLFLPPGSHKLVRAQGTFLDDGEVRAVIQDLTSRAKPEFHPELIRIKSPGSDAGDGSRDPLFDDAVRIILESKRGSVSLLQRRLMVGYSRASRLIDQMADGGIVGEYKGSQAREVLITPKEWQAIRGNVAADIAQGYEADQEDTDDDDDPAWEQVPALSDNHDIRG